MQNVGNYTVTIAANSVHRHPSGGRYFKIIKATGSLNLRTERYRLNALVAGQGMENVQFDYIEITDVSGASNTVTFVIGDTGFLDGISGVMQVTSTVPVQSGSFANAQKTVTNASAQLLAGNTARKYLLIQNNDAVGSIFVSFGAAATLANGVKIAPGGAFEMADAQSTQELFAIGSIASNSNIVMVEG